MSLEEENIAIIRRYTEACNEQDLAKLKELVSPDYFHSGLQLRGWEEYKKLHTMLWKAFPDFHEINEDFIAKGDKVWYRIKWTGTHTGEYQGLAPTGKKITVTGVSIKTIANGKIVESWAVYDFLDSYKQLGVIEYTEKGKQLFPEKK